MTIRAKVGDELLAVADALAERVDALGFGGGVAFVYNPLGYARAGYAAYVARYARRGVDTVLLGMNPGPFGMAQTGVPFGHVGLVREWMGIEASIGRPVREHPKRPVEGFACPRSEVSGQRLWGWAKARFGAAERFFERFFVLNYCPLAFLEASGRNLTPDKLAASEKRALFAACDDALRGAVAALSPARLVGVGRFACDRAQPIADAAGIACGAIPHPSPASPAANRGWAAAAESALAAMGVVLP